MSRAVSKLRAAGEIDAKLQAAQPLSRIDARTLT
jgi:hypothetical protein